LEEVFGKASVGDDKEEAAKATIGPVPPSENEYDPAEI